MPDSLIDHCTQGFGVPVDELFQGRLAVLAADELKRFCDETGRLDHTEANRVVRTADGAKRWYLLDLRRWWRTFVAGDARRASEPAEAHA